MVCLLVVEDGVGLVDVVMCVDVVGEVDCVDFVG